MKYAGMPFGMCVLMKELGLYDLAPALCRLVWDMNKVENDAYLEKALSGIPEHFSSKLLEVPVGTGILTMPLYKTLPKADIEKP